MKQRYIFIGIAFLTALLAGGCGLLGGDDDGPIQVRVFNQTGYDIERYDFRLSIGDSSYFQVFNFEYSDLPDGEKSEYEHVPVTTNNIVGYRIRLTKVSEQIGVIRFRLDSSLHGEDRAPLIRSGNYTYILEFTSRDFVFYTTTQDLQNEEEVRIRVRNTGNLDYEQVSVWLSDGEGSMGSEIELGPVAAGGQSSYHTVENAIQFTRIRVVTAAGDTVDNEPLELFGNTLPPGDYTYHAEVKTDDLHDYSRVVKD